MFYILAGILGVGLWGKYCSYREEKKAEKYAREHPGKFNPYYDVPWD